MYAALWFPGWFKAKMSKQWFIGFLQVWLRSKVFGKFRKYYFTFKGFWVIAYCSSGLAYQSFMGYLMLKFDAFVNFYQNNNYIYFNSLIWLPDIGMMVRVFTNVLGGLGLIRSRVRVIQQTQKKWYLMPPCLTLSIIR